MAAQAAGLSEVILPERNESDLDDLPADVRKQMRFYPVRSIDEVLALALEPSEVAIVA
jgi:ATP-dependent Lon protease